MYEVEIKVPADHGAVRTRLETVGAERGETYHQRDVYYDAPHRAFAETDEALRIRQTTQLENDTGDAGLETTRLTYKGPLLDEESKTRSEHETGLEDAEEAAEILVGIGFEPAATVEKRREYWSFEGFTVSLDAVEGVGEFLEIERAITEKARIDTVRNAAIETLDRLGLDVADQVRTSYLGLLLEGE